MNTCKTCQFWHRDINNEWGECEQITDSLDSDKARIFSDGGLFGLECTGEFGCVLWEERDYS